MLRAGSEGEDVKALQRLLKVRGVDPGPVDGIFGPKTEAAVRAYQDKAGLDVDGIAGPKTMEALKEAAPEQPQVQRPRRKGGVQE